MQREFLQHLRQRQGGVVTLAVGVLLLVLITLVTLYGARVGLMEQRISANEYRSKLVNNAAETARGQATEFLNSNLPVFKADEDVVISNPDGTTYTVAGWVKPDQEKWIALDCDSPATTKEGEACDDSQNAGLSGSLYVYDGAQDDGVEPAALDVFATGTQMSADRVNVNQGKEGDELRVGFNADYVLCPLNMEMVDHDNDSSTPEVPRVVDSGDTCEGRLEDLPDTRYFAILVRSKGYLLGEDTEGNFVELEDQVNAHTNEVLIKFDLFGAGPQLPLTIGAAFTGSGGFNIVANPNGGPSTQGGGRSGAPFSVWAKGDYSMGGNTITCQRHEFFADDPGGNEPHNGPPPNDQYTVCYSCSCPNEVFWQLSSGSNGGGKGPGIDIVDKDDDFPDDLFFFTFGIPREDHEILKDMAQLISSTDPDAKYDNCGELQPNDSGLFWVENDSCKIQDKTGGIGTPHNPVVVISEGYVTFNSGAKMFGVIYVFENGMKLNGGAQIYGAVVGDPVPGHEFDGSGQGDNVIVYDQQVLNRVSVSPDFQRVSPMPGTWTDRSSAP
jgi:hypothetical protein